MSDKRTSMRFLIAAAACLFAAAAVAQTAPTVSLTATPANADGSATPALTWSSTGASTCIASGGWSGTKPTNGTEALSPIVVTTTYTLTCSSATGDAPLSWTPPTTRTDGSPLTNLAQYGIYNGPSVGGLARLRNIPAPASSYIVTGLAPGTHFFSMTAIDRDNIESVLSTVVSKVVTAPSAAANASVQVRSLPNPPTAVTILASVYEWQEKGGSLKLAKVGSIPLGRPCSMHLSGDFYLLEDFDAVRFTGAWRGGPAIGVCGQATV